MSEIPAPAAGENLYGWTDENRVGVNLYKWTEPGESLYAWTYRGYVVYTHSPMPLAGDYIYNADGTVVSTNTQVEEDSNGSTMYDGYSSWSRDSANDIIETDTSYYTHSATPVVGMHLYNENDIDTGYIISTVNQNNSIEVSTPPATYVVSFYRGSNINSFTVDGTTYTTYDNHILLTEGTHTLSVVYTSHMAGDVLVGNSYLLSSSTSCSFTVNSTTVNFNNGTKTFTIGTTVVINWAISK